jgi:hypothetical protein
MYLYGLQPTRRRWQSSPEERSPVIHVKNIIEGHSRGSIDLYVGPEVIRCDEH